MKKYGILSILFLLLSLMGGIFLVKNKQDNRNQAIDDNKICSPGQQSCQENPQGKNTGFMCKCFTDMDPNVWRCNTQDLTNCPTDSGSTDAPWGSYKVGCVVNGDKVGEVTGRCITAIAGKKLPQMWKYTCPGRKDILGGCQENEQVIPAGSSSVCFENNFCGSQQIDSDVWETCFISVVDSCATSPTTPPRSPTNTPIPTSTPRPTNTPTPTPGPSSTPTPTNTPGPTSTPTPGPSSTPGPTSTPVPPTNTPIPTDVIAKGPSPTRIILPESGIEFPSQILTIIGGIVTLLGFLILL